MGEQILYGENQATDFPQEIKTVYEPSVVLDGYEVSERIFQSKLLRIYYIDNNKGEYSFQQATMDFWAGYNTENVLYEEVEVNGHDGIIYVQNGQRHLQWQQDEYIFEFIGNQTLEEFNRLAASVKQMED